MTRKKKVLASGILLAAAIAAFLLWKMRPRKTIPDGATAVKPFDLNRYLGKWYEIARFDFKQERGLNNTSAHYSLNDDGSVRVVNRGFNYEKGEWKEATGKARFVNGPDEAMLKVSFFGPFYSGYNVIAIDSEYRYALIAGESLDYLWLLSREKTMPKEIKQAYVGKAASIGYDTTRLLWVEHD